MKNFKGKVAAITGASSGMGRELAIELASLGCHLSLSDVNEAELQETAKLAQEHGVRVTTAVVNVADRKAVFDWAARTAADHGKVNLIFNNAGVALVANADDVPQAEFEWIMGINFWGVVNGTQAFMPYLRASGEGHVINTSSLFGLMAMTSQSAYNASKFAVRGYTECLRIELEAEGACVSATCVHPGGIATNIANASKIDQSYVARSGVSESSQRKLSNKLIQTTTAKAAAQKIVKAVRQNKRRLLIGPDAWVLDKLVRLLGSAYQSVVVARTLRMKRSMQSAKN